MSRRRKTGGLHGNDRKDDFSLIELEPNLAFDYMSLVDAERKLISR